MLTENWHWQYVFLAQKHSTNLQTSTTHRHYILEGSVQKAMKRAMQRAGISKNGSYHTLHHSFAAHLLEDGYDIRTVQELLEHKDVKTIMSYTHFLQKRREPLKVLVHKKKSPTHRQGIGFLAGI